MANLIGAVSLPVSDPRVEKVAAITRDLLAKMRDLEGITDAAALMRARLVLEHEFVEAWDALGLDRA